MGQFLARKKYKYKAFPLFECRITMQTFTAPLQRSGIELMGSSIHLSDDFLMSRP